MLVIFKLNIEVFKLEYFNVKSLNHRRFMENIIMKLENTYTINEVVEYVRKQGYSCSEYLLTCILVKQGILIPVSDIELRYNPTDFAIYERLIKRHKKHYLAEENFSAESVGSMLFEDDKDELFWKYKLTDMAIKLLNKGVFTFGMFEISKKERGSYTFTERGRDLAHAYIGNGLH